MFLKLKKDFELKKNYLKENLKAGVFVKIYKSFKTYQVIGINHTKSICWMREWPINYSSKSFEILIKEINLIKYH